MVRSRPHSGGLRRTCWSLQASKSDTLLDGPPPASMQFGGRSVAREERAEGSPSSRRTLGIAACPSSASWANRLIEFGSQG
jgi:hypothetical protein